MILFRKGGVLPKDITMDGNRIIFNRPLNKTDEGVYECEARNSVGSMKAEVNVQVQGTSVSLYDLLMCTIFILPVGKCIKIYNKGTKDVLSRLLHQTQ